MIHQSINQGAEARVYIRADALAPYSRVTAVLGAVESNGVRDVAFFVDQRNRPYTFF